MWSFGHNLWHKLDDNPLSIFDAKTCNLEGSTSIRLDTGGGGISQKLKTFVRDSAEKNTFSVI